uniref:Enkurin domain-containing protein n=1 Tax=Strigamia maritima TaxID=126957 RepID=T1ILL9_STRMM
MSVSSFRSNSTVNDLLDNIQAQATYPYFKHRIQSRDFARENVIKIRQLSASNKPKKQLQPLKADWKIQNSKYDHVKPKISTFLHSTSRQIEKLDENSIKNEEIVPKLRLNLENEDPRSRRPSSSSIENCAIVKSYVKQNAAKAKFTPLKRCNSASDLDAKRNEYMPGFVPKYLIERKKEIFREKERERERKNENKKKEIYPNGHVLMSQEERLDTLKQMKEHEEKLVKKLASMPICMNTLRLRREKEQIEQQLVKLEEGIKIFSRPKNCESPLGLRANALFTAL